MKRALVSVYDKGGLVEFAQELAKLGWEMIATGGTAKVLEKGGLKVIPMEKITGSPQAFGGRLKTISFNTLGALLFDRRSSRDVKEARKLKIQAIDLVVLNLYPFLETITKRASSLAEAIEMIDIGGPTLVRAAAKNYQSVTVVIDPQDYALVLKELKENGKTTLKTREKLAHKVFNKTAQYDQTIETYLAQKFLKEKKICLSFSRGRKLRYGENPHQEGWFYQDLDSQDPLALGKFRQLQGKALSFNNLLDIDGAIEAVLRLGGARPACVIVKHANPSGAALREKILEAFEAAWQGDPLASFGGIIIVNREINQELAREMLAQKKFFEVLLAPAVRTEAEEVFKEKTNLRVLINPALENPQVMAERDFKKIYGGILIQNKDTKEIRPRDLKVVTRLKPSLKQTQDLLFAWKIAQVSRSNSVTIAKDQMLLGSGVGQQDRRRACKIAIEKAGKRARGGVAASDGFFPFADGPRILAKAGVKAIIQPGGSLRDQESIEACDKAKVAMVLTGIRCFKH